MKQHAMAAAVASAASLAFAAAAEKPAAPAYLDESKGDIGWYQVGPGELVTLRTRQDISGDPSDASTRVVSVVNRPWHEAVWVGGSFWVSEEARKGEILNFEWRTDHPFVQLVKIEDSTGLAGIWNLGVGTQWGTAWINIRAPHQMLGQGVLKDVARVEFSSYVHPPHNNELSEVFVKNIRVLPIEPIPVSGRDWKAAERAPAAPGYRAGVTIHNIGRGTDFPGINIPEGLAMAKEVVDHLYGIYGESVSVSTAYPGGDWGKDFADFMRDKGLYYASEGHISGGLGNLDRLGALQKDRFGNTYKDYPGVDGTHGEDLTNKDWLEWAKGMVNASATAGARDWRAIDYVWPCHGGVAWGYTDSTKNFFRDALLGRGVGLETVGADGAPRVMRFAEYFRHYMGYDPSLADIGIERWEDYEPPLEGNGNFRHWQMHDLLVSYAWVVAMNELGRDANAIDGLLMKPVLNPENIETGTDMWGLMQGRFIGGASVEWWAAADCVVQTYYAGPYYGNVFRKYGKDLIITGETSAAGGDPWYGRPYYWDNPATYLILYAMSAATDAREVFNQYWQSSLGRMLAEGTPDHESYLGFLAAWDGFLQAKADKATRLPTDVMVLANRPIADRSYGFDRLYLAQGTAGRALSELNYNHVAGAFPLDDAFDLEDYDLLFFSPVHAPKGFSGRLASWLAAKEKRTLVVFGSGASAFHGDGSERVPCLGKVARTDVSSGRLSAPDRTFRRVFGKRLDEPFRMPGGLYEAPSAKGAKTLLALDGKPLVSIVPCGKSRVIYVHCDFGGTEERSDETLLVRAIMEYLGRKPVAICDSGSYAAMGFRLDGRRLAYIIHNNVASYDVIDDKGRTWWSFQTDDPRTTGGSLRCRVPGKKGAAWNAVDMTAGTQSKLVADADGYVTISMDHRNIRGVILSPAE